MFKSVRNVLLKNKISFDNEVVDWKVLETVFEMDSKNQSFQLLPKISKEHVYPDGFQKLSVKRATQVFSESVSTGIKCAILSGVFKTDEEKETAESTANFFCRLNILFDKLNTGQLYSRNPNQKVLSDSTSTLNDLKEARHWIETWKSSGSHSRPPCFKGLCHTLWAIELMWEHHKGNGQNYFLLSHLNTDAAENVFSMLRSNRGSYEKNPSVIRLVRNLKELMFHNITIANTSGYNDAKAKCLIDFEELRKTRDDEGKEEQEFTETNVGDMLNLNIDIAAEMETIMSAQDEDDQMDDMDEDDIHEQGEQDDKLLEITNQIYLEHNYCAVYTPSEKVQNAASLYYAGSAVHKLQKILKCQQCYHYLFDEKVVDREQTVLVELRAYETTATTSKYGKLNVPSLIFEKTVREVEKHVKERLTEYIRKPDIEKTWALDIKRQMERFLVKCCSEEHKVKVIRYLLTGLTIFTLRNTNQTVGQGSGPKYV